MNPAPPEAHCITCGHFPLDCARLLISSTVFLRESWSDRDTNTGRMYFIRAARGGEALVWEHTASAAFRGIQGAAHGTGQRRAPWDTPRAAVSLRVGGRSMPNHGGSGKSLRLPRSKVAPLVSAAWKAGESKGSKADPRSARTEEGAGGGQQLQSWKDPRCVA